MLKGDFNISSPNVGILPGCTRFQSRVGDFGVRGTFEGFYTILGPLMQVVLVED